jgi:hypothetical protein
MQRWTVTILALSLFFLGLQILSPRGWLRMVSWAGIEVPGLDTSLAEVPNQYTVDGRPQVLVYGPTNCAPTSQTIRVLAQHNIPYQFRNADEVSQDELGAVVLSLPRNASGGSPLVLVNGKVLIRPTIHEIWAEYTQMQPRT